MSDYLLLLFGVLLVVGTGLFVASEFAIINLDRVDLESRRSAGEKGLDLSIRAVATTATQLSSAQLGITLTVLLTGFVSEPALSRLLYPSLSYLGFSESGTEVFATVLAMAIATIASFLLGELVPKNMALSAPKKVLKAVAPFQLGFTFIFKFLIVFLNNNGNFILRRFGIEPKEELSVARSAEELTSLVRRSASLGTLESDTAKLIEKTLTLTSLLASDIMTPRPQMHTLEREQSAKDLIDLARESGHSRFPILGEDSDDIVGVAHVKQAVAIPPQRRAQVPVSAIMVEPVRVPETMPLDRLILTLRGRGLQFGVVVDEYGGTAGIATLEDAVEELIGDLSDEHDRTKAHIVQYSDGSASFSGLARPGELREIGLKISDDEDYDTIAGFVMSELGKIPQDGDVVELPTGQLKVIRMDGRRVDRIKYQPSEEDND
ncbi:MAG: hemolysin family protein [Aquiluna sp.]